MCGIVAIACLERQPQPEVVERMVARLVHRGPDAKQCVWGPFCHLGHARLSIIDLTTGAQPMKAANGRYWITFNGEIYNYRDLREELLQKGSRFSTRSDTEVVMEAYATWGASCVQRFRGMFAFVIWDTATRRIFAARDPFGEKPLYYATARDGVFLLASEIKGLLASGLVEPQLDLGAVDAYLALGYVPPDRTIYRNVESLAPGHYLEWTRGQVYVARYWLPRLNTDAVSTKDAAEHLHGLLQQAVRRQMVADVPVGAFLSGGLDSSTVVALMQQQSEQPIKTFSVGFGDQINELPYARAVAKKYHTEHHEIDLGTPPVAEMLGRMAEVYDEPFADTSSIPTYLISEFARSHVKVVLSGDGGDELFGGYDWYPPLAKSERVSGSWAKWALLRLLSRCLRESVQPLRVYSLAVGLAHRWPDMWMRGAMSNICFRENQRALLWAERKGDVSSFMPGGYFQPTDDTKGLNRSFYFDLTCYLPGNILVKVDRAAMAHGLETRSPFLDRDLAEFALSLPATLKVSDGRTKVLLRSACEQYWPAELRFRKKQGFGAPYDVWLRFPAVQRLLHQVFGERSKLCSLLPGVFAERRRANPSQIWSLLSLGLWLETHEAAL